MYCVVIAFRIQGNLVLSIHLASPLSRLILGRCCWTTRRAFFLRFLKFSRVERCAKTRNLDSTVLLHGPAVQKQYRYFLTVCGLVQFIVHVACRLEQFLPPPVTMPQFVSGITKPVAMNVASRVTLMPYRICASRRAGTCLVSVVTLPNTCCNFSCFTFVLFFLSPLLSFDCTTSLIMMPCWTFSFLTERGYAPGVCVLCMNTTTFSFAVRKNTDTCMHIHARTRTQHLWLVIFGVSNFWTLDACFVLFWLFLTCLWWTENANAVISIRHHV